MAEFDFDELDKAVNSLMSGVDTSKRPEGLDDPADKVVTLDPSVAEPTAAPTSAAAPTPSPVTSPAPDKPAVPVAVPTLATKRRGQFMDIVRPSTGSQPVQKTVKRNNIVLQPTSAVTPETTTPAAEPATSQTPSSFEMESTGTPEKPEPVPATTRTAVFSTARSTPFATKPEPSAPSVSSETDKSTEISTPESTDLSTNSPTPLVSPFLADAKVEKRPLGGTPPTTDESSSDTDESDQPVVSLPSASELNIEPSESTGPSISSQSSEQTASSSDQITARTTDKTADQPDENSADPTTVVSNTIGSDVETTSKVSTSLPEELGSDVVAVESTDLSTHVENSEAASQMTDKTADSPDQKSANATPEVHETAKSSEPETRASVPGGGSIPQQYTEQASTGDQTNGSIYDTATYHQPIDSAKAAKKTSSMRWLIWVIALLIVGAIAGAAAYYFTR